MREMEEILGEDKYEGASWVGASRKEEPRALQRNRTWAVLASEAQTLALLKG